MVKHVGTTGQNHFFRRSIPRSGKTWTKKIETEEKGYKHSSNDNHQLFELLLLPPAVTDMAKFSLNPGTTTTAA